MIKEYLAIEKEAMEWFKEATFLVLILGLSYRIVMEVPFEGPLDQAMRCILLGLGYCLIPGMCLKIYLLFSKKAS